MKCTYHLKCNVPEFEVHKGYNESEDGKKLAISDFQSLQRQFAAKGYKLMVCFTNKPLRGTIQVEVDGFYYYLELYKED